MNINTEPLCEVVDLCKSYPGVVANGNLSIKFHAGSIHGLLGENGCGKSTLIKTLSGVHKPDSGEIRYQGEEVHFNHTTDATNNGIATVYQEFSIVPTLSVAENILLGRMPCNRFGFIDWQEANRLAMSVLAEMEIGIPPEAITGSLSVGEQQLVEIAKALAANARMIILDEPTAALGHGEIEHLHALLRRLKDKGCAILYVSHRLDEVERIVDEVTILRNGRVVQESGEVEISIENIVSAMIGSDVEEHYPKDHNVQPEILMEVQGLSTAEGVNGVSFNLHAGEVLGLGGVLGSGRTEIAHALFGVDKLSAGEIFIQGVAVSIDSPKQAITAGMALVPENRKFDGLFFNFAASGNITAASLSQLSSCGVLNLQKEHQLTQDYIRDLEISPQADDKTVGLLSGGNQQKIVIARWLLTDAKILILDEPTQGIDIGAKLAVYKLINQLTKMGKAVILISSDHDELLAMSDRVAVVNNGAISKITYPSNLNHTDLVQVSVDNSSNSKHAGKS